MLWLLRLLLSLRGLATVAVATICIVLTIASTVVNSIIPVHKVVIIVTHLKN